jgi:hypothetical protein
LLAERGVVDYDPSIWNPEKLISVCHFHACALSSAQH